MLASQDMAVVEAVKRVSMGRAMYMNSSISEYFFFEEHGGFQYVNNRAKFERQ